MYAHHPLTIHCPKYSFQRNCGDQSGGQEDVEPRVDGKSFDGNRNSQDYETRAHRGTEGFRVGRALYLPGDGVLLRRRLVQIHQEEEGPAGICRQILPPTNRVRVEVPAGEQRLAS